MASNTVNVVDHPLIQHKLTRMREKDTPPAEFRALLREIAMLMGYEITRVMATSTRDIETPITAMKAPVVTAPNVVLVPILRAGLGMTGGLLELMPSALVGHIGVFRDPETHRPVEYYAKLPPNPEALHLLVDPMLATGYSAVHVADVMNKMGVSDKNIRFMVLVAAPEGIKVFHERHPDIPIFVAAIDDHLNEKDYIVPGLGDAGDRIFGTL